VGSLRDVAICGVVRACTLQGRELCLGRWVVGPVTALAGGCLQDVERGAHEGGKGLLASCLRPVSSKATHPPTYVPLHTFKVTPAFPRRVNSSPRCCKCSSREREKTLTSSRYFKHICHLNPARIISIAL